MGTGVALLRAGCIGTFTMLPETHGDTGTNVDPTISAFIEMSYRKIANNLTILDVFPFNETYKHFCNLLSLKWSLPRFKNTNVMI